jgi:hypothetical protein
MWFTSSRVPWKALLAGLAAQQLDDAAHAALAHRVLALDHQRTGAHAQDRAVAAAVEGQRGLFHLVVGGRGARGQEARADPAHQVLAGHVVGAEHDHAAAAAVADPVFGQAMPWAVLAQAALTWVFGPRAPMYSANWLWPIARMRKMKRRSNS